MGLDNFKTKSSNQYRAYDDHEYDDRLNQWKDEFKDRFPVRLNIEFIEVSPNMTKTWGKATYKPDGTCYIRMSEDFLYNHNDEQIKMTLLHEMCHVYFYRMGYKDTNHDKFFRWVVGRVMGDLTHTSFNNQKWIDCIEPFLEEHNQF